MKTSLAAFWSVLALSGCVSRQTIRQVPDGPPLPPGPATFVEQRMRNGFVPTAALDTVIAWRYQAGASNYWWNPEQSSNLVDWVVVGTNVTGSLTVTNQGGIRFFRLRGRP